MRDAVVIVGDGPAGRAVVAACAALGLETVLVGPDPARPWPNTYGAWTDELPRDLVGAVAHRYDAPVVRTDAARLTLDRAYAVLDNGALQQALRDRAAHGGAREVAGRAVAVDHDADGCRVRLTDGRSLPAGAVIDASGAGELVRRARGAEPAWQVAYGIVGRFEPQPVATGAACFMDWRTVPGDGGGAAGPTFCYTLALGDGLALVEETSLAARPARPVTALRPRLERRLAATGVTLVRQTAVEEVRIPMGGPVPARDQPVVAFGAAAGMVHPATGYQVAAALRTAPVLGAALAAALAAPGATPAAVAQAGWSAVWPADRLRQRALHAFGLEVLLGLDRTGLQRFFEAFFSLPTREWSAYVSGAPRAFHAARVMLRVAARVPPRLRVRLLAHALGADGVRLARDLAAAGRSASVGWPGTPPA